MVKTPAAAINYSQQLLRATEVWGAFGKNNTVQEGIYKGWNKELMRLFRVLPAAHTIKKATDPETAESFYNLIGY